MTKKPLHRGGTQDTDFNKGFTKGMFTENVRKFSGKFPIRSHGNSRGVNSRELRRVFGHSSESSGAFLTKIGGNYSYRPPGPF